MADLKITELSALTTVLGEDLLAIVDDPTGTASTKKIRAGDFQSTWHVGARVTNSTDTTIADVTATELDWDTEDWDTDTIHDAGNPERLTCKTAGKYFYWCIINYDGDAQGDRQARLYLGGLATGTLTAASKSWNLGATATCYVVLAGTIDLAVNEYISFVAVHLAGNNLDVNALYSECGMQRIG